MEALLDAERGRAEAERRVADQAVLRAETERRVADQAVLRAETERARAEFAERAFLSVQGTQLNLLPRSQ